EIQKLRIVTEGIRRYSDIAHLKPTGKPFIDGKGIKWETPLSTILDGTYIVENGKLYFKGDAESETKYELAIQKYPTFPFSYYALSLSLKRRNDPSWRQIATNAISILEQTTIIEGCDEAHADALKDLRSELLK